jgi:hypothetical protein
VITRLRAFKEKAFGLLPVRNGGQGGKSIDEWRQQLAERAIEVASNGLAGWRFTRQHGADYVMERDAVFAAVKRNLPEGGYVPNAQQMAKARAQSQKCEVGGTGWLLLDLDDVVYLVSKSRDVTIAFPCEKPCQDFRRLRAYAQMYAYDYPEPKTEAAPAAL